MRVYFDPTKDGYLRYDIAFKQGEVIAFDILDTLTWGEAKRAIDGLVVPVATHVDSNYRFVAWSPKLPADGDLVESAYFTAVYEKINVIGPIMRNNGPRTGVAGLSMAAIVAAAAGLGLYVTRSRKEN
ncbi:hypothetical protein [uncultured Anaerococcus sp.]|uniref:hypothetical protein n=1 Tax=uncultured Anaerococcus sp. TaxID=293428 RepID=UPI00288B0C78|nr:hypothetical protein [uncultured Anaerococcus sp.]